MATSANRAGWAPRWLVWTAAALLSWGVWAVLSKLAGDALSGAHSQAVSTLGSLPVLAMLMMSGRLAAPGRRLRGIVIASIGGIISALGNIAYYHVLGQGAKAATVVPLTALYPIVTITLAVVFLREKLNRIQLAGVIVSILAIYLFNVPDDKGLISSALVYAVIPLVLWGCSGFFQKLCTRDVSGELSALCYLGAFLPVAAGILAHDPLDFGTISVRSWIVLSALGFFLAVGNWAILQAFASGGKASVITPMSGLYPAVSVPIAILAFGEKVGPREIAGILLALVSVAALSAETAERTEISE